MPHPDERFLKKHGAENLSKSSAGREILARLQKHYEKDILQPGDPRFNQVYGAQVKKRERDLEAMRKKSADEWAAREEQKAYQLKQKEGPSDWKSKRL